MSRESVSLLLGIPSTEAEFFKRVNHSDYLSPFTLDPERSWISYERNVAIPLTNLATFASSRGIRVAHDADRASISSATADSDVVVLLSHWKGPDVASYDFLADQPEAFLDRWISSISAPPPRLTGNWRRELAAALSTLADRNESSVLSDDGIVDVMSPNTRNAEHREQIDIAFSGLLSPGNRLELDDGLQSKEEVASSIDARFCGALDLTTCTSTYLADYLDRVRRSAFRVVQFPTVQDIDVACAVLMDTFGRWYHDGCEYQEARRYALLEAHATVSAARRRNAFKWPWRILR